MTTGDFVAFHAALFALLGGVHGLVRRRSTGEPQPVWGPRAAAPRDAHEDAHAAACATIQGGVTIAGLCFAYPADRGMKDVDLEVPSGDSSRSWARRLGQVDPAAPLLGFEAPGSGYIRYDMRTSPRSTSST